MNRSMLDISAGPFIDAMTKLAVKYYKIGLVDIANNTYMELTDEVSDNAGAVCFSDYTDQIGLSGEIHKDDIDELLDFISVSNLKSILYDGGNIKEFKYRRLVDGKMRWVSLDVMAKDYDNSEQLYIFLRDISQDYRGIIEEHKNNSTGMVYHFKASVDDERALKKIVGDVANGITDVTERKKFIDTYSPDNLKKNYEQRKRQLDMNVPYNYFGKRVVVHTTGYIVPNDVTNEIECIVNGIDMSERYIDEVLPKMLYEKEYEMVAVVDIEDKKVKIKEYLNSPRTNDRSNRYDYYSDKVARTFIAEEEREEFLERVNLESVCRRLDKQETYEFSIYHKLFSREKRLKKYTFRRVKMFDDCILVTMEDITEIFERDVLTGGMNRKGFIRNAGKIIKNSKENEKFAILYYNINNFKAYNEMFGLTGGDEILRFMYHMLETSSLQPDIVARLEADHFVCLIREEKLDYEVLADTCKSYFNYKGKVISLNAKCGIYNVIDRNMEVVGMCDRAKLAKRYIKDEYLKPYEVFSRDMNEQYLDKSELIGNINTAFEKGEIKPFFQPVYEAKTGRLASAEALVRWVSTEKGVISPGLFIPALEETGHISQIDSYMEMTVRKFLEKRICKGLSIVPISINLSWMDLYDEGMMQDIIRSVKNSKLEKGIERFEVTETSYAALSNYGNNTLDILRDMGAKLYLDDFGSGFSSFSTVRDYEFDIIKLDMGFVQKITGDDAKVRNIIKSIIDMAHSVNMSVIAEGAETQVQVDFLVEAECDYIQGYYFSKPLTQEEFERLLDESYI